MRIVIGSDHGGFDLKEAIKTWLGEWGHEVIDVGTHSRESCDYPDYAEKAAKMVVAGEADRGVLICGTGIGIGIAANKVRGIRCALCTDTYMATMSRAHNDANMLALGARVIGHGLAEAIVKIWLETPFEGGRHQRRLDKIHALE